MKEIECKLDDTSDPLPVLKPNENVPADLDIPDGGYGWVVVAGIFTINAFAWGVSSVYSRALPIAIHSFS